MRIIGGKLRRRRLETPKDEQTTRPMPDYVREAVFNLLRGHSEGHVVLDLFSGTGAIGLEAISHGASRCVFFEQDKKMASVIERNVESLGVEERCEVVRGDALGPLVFARCPSSVHLIFFDPPYRLVLDSESWERCRAQLGRLIQMLDDDGYLVLRTPYPAIRRVGGSVEECESPVESKRKRRGRKKQATEVDEEGDRVIEVSGVGGGGDWSVEDWEDAEDLSTERRVEDIDLSIEGALGPETHDYGRMGVHLYMRRR